MFTERDAYFMQKAIDQALIAKHKDEVPVGAVLVLHDEIVGEGHNQSITTHDPSAHAEMIALRHAAKKIGNYRLIDTTLYVTLEPCLMCAGAIVHARINKLVFGTHDPKTGAILSVTHALDQPFHNHRVSYAGGLLAASCGALLSDFFKSKR